MGYSALLFCPDEKTARTVTQVLSELEFTIEACTEPFAAVKKLMGQHFDAVVVDCDNEQNATLLFKSARNSASNQTSLAVAVVEGQAGVAKAFRIGANLVLTKPINIEQSKGTLRVARGLLRKGEPAKPATPPAATAPVKPVASPIPEIKAATPVATPLTAEPTSTPMVKPTPAWPAAAAVASTASSAHDDDLLELDAEEPKKPVVQPESHPAMNLFSSPTAAPSTGGAASATAPARERAEAAAVEKTPIPSRAVMADKAAPPVEPAANSIVGSAPSFTFGGMTADGEESSGSGKKIILGMAAAVIVAAGLYVGITHFSGTTSNPAGTDVAPAGTPANVAHPVASTPKTTSAEKPSATLTPGSQPKFPEPNRIQNIIDETAGDTHAKTADDEQSESTPEPAPLMVRGGKMTKAPKTADAPAPSMIGMGTPDATAPPANLVPSASPSLRPTLSTLNVSQGVSTGLLIKKVAPSYPSNALRMRVEGNVELVATISKEGNISNIKIVSGDAQLTKAAVDAVKQWKYKPYLLNGEPVEIQTQVTIKFKLPR
ncbi:MAG TPA: TonB family protein [Candidatus Sulfotelmatobacter sp.]